MLTVNLSEIGVSDPQTVAVENRSHATILCSGLGHSPATIKKLAPRPQPAVATAWGTTSVTFHPSWWPLTWRT